MRKPNLTHNLFKENFLVFQQAANDSQGISFSNLASESPLKEDQGLVNPTPSVNEFLDEEHQRSGNAMQDPISGIYKGTRDELKAAVKELLSIPQTAANMITQPLGLLTEKTGKVLGKMGKAAFNLPARLLMSPPALALNIAGKATNVLKLGVSAINVGLSTIVRAPIYKGSKLFRTGRDKSVEKIDSISSNLAEIGNTAKAKVSNLQIPVIGQWDTPGSNGAANDNVEGENEMPFSEVA